MQPTEQTYCTIINQLHTLLEKCINSAEPLQFKRHFDRINQSFEELGYFIKNPIGESYDLTRLDCEASIVGEQVEDLKIIEVIKPIIYLRDREKNQIIQRAVVIVQSQK